MNLFILGITETHSALYLLKDEGFKGSRPDVPNIGIVITDGKSFHTNLTSQAASDLEAQGIYIRHCYIHTSLLHTYVTVIYIRHGYINPSWLYTEVTLIYKYMSLLSV